MRQLLSRVRNVNRRGLIEAAGLSALILYSIAVMGHLGINPTPSMPIGIYELSKLNRPIHRGDIVQLCPPDGMASLARERGYVTGGTCSQNISPFIKYVAAVAGDVVDLRAGGVWVNGHRLDGSTPVAYDMKHLPLPSLARGRYQIKAGQIWAWSPYPRSLDSRYFGPVDISRVRYLADLAIQVQPWPWYPGLASLPR
jgi:conjugative transfer signal peptidase TraF